MKRSIEHRARMSASHRHKSVVSQVATERMTARKDGNQQPTTQNQELKVFTLMLNQKNGQLSL